MNRFVADSAFTFLTSVFNRGLTIVSGIVLARYLGPVGKGYVAYAPIGLLLFVTAMNGVAQAVTMQYGRDKLPGGAVHAAMLRIVIATSIPSMLVLAAVAIFIPSQGVLLAAAAALPFALYTTAAVGLLLGADRVQATNVQSMIVATGFNGLTIALVVLVRADYRLVLGAWVLSYVAAAIYSYIACRPFISDGSHATAAIVRRQVSFGGTSGIAQLAGYLNMRIDVFVVSFLLGAKALGLYTLAIGLAEMLWQLSSPLCVAAFPRIATAGERESADFTAKLIRHIFALMLPAGVVCFIAGPPLIALVYGQAFAPSGDALRWIMPGVLAYAVEVPLGYFLMVRLARPWLIVAIQSASIVACGALTAATVHRFGINGAAAATSITYVAVVLVKGWVFARSTGTQARHLLLVRRDEISRLVHAGRRVFARFSPT